MAVTAESAVLQNMLPTLEAEGYEVYLKPSRLLLPPFVKRYVPDAIALRKDKNIAIAIASKSDDQRKRIETAIAEFKDQPDWELRVVWLEPLTQGDTLAVQSEKTVSERIAGVHNLLDQGQIEASLLMGWATFEALARALSVRQFERPQPAGRLVEFLATEGYLTPSEADKLRVLVDKRNRVAHGDFRDDVSRQDVIDLIAVLEEMGRQRQHVN